MGIIWEKGEEEGEEVKKEEKEKEKEEKKKEEGEEWEKWEGERRGKKVSRRIKGEGVKQVGKWVKEGEVHLIMCVCVCVIQMHMRRL